MRNRNLTIAIPLLIMLVRLSAFAQSTLTLAWNASPDPNVVGYHLYEGVQSRTYTNMLTVGNVLTAQVTGLQSGVTYFFAVTAYTSSGLESSFSNEISWNDTNTVAPPVFTVQPKSSTNGFGGSLTLTGLAGTNSSYQWFLGSQALTWTGSKSNSLTLPFLTWTNNGVYTLQASNSAGVATSAPASVAVTPPTVVNVRVTGP